MTVLIISALFPPEPVVSAKLSYDIALACLQKGKVIVFSPQPSRPLGFHFHEIVENFKFKHIQVDSFICAPSKIIGRFRESYSFGKASYNYIKNNYEHINVIYVNTWPLFGQYFATKAAKRYNIPLIIHVQDIYPESFSNKFPIICKLINFFLLPIDKYVLNNATHVIAISEKMKNYLVQTRNIEEKKLTVINNWQNEIDFANYHSLNTYVSGNKIFTLMYLGNVGPVAGIDFLIESFAKACLQNCRLVIAGDGSEKEKLIKKAREMNFNSVEFWNVPEGRVPEIQGQADVMILPIKKGAASSSIPSKLPAYMFSKKPIIACVDDNSDTANSIICSNCGWIIPPENQEKLVQLLKDVVCIPDTELKQKGQKGYDYAIEHYSKKNNLGKVIGIINEIILK